MITPYVINSTVWTPLTNAGKTGKCWLDVDKDEEAGNVDIRIFHTDGTPVFADLTNSPRAYEPNSNIQFFKMDPDSPEDIFYARAFNQGDAATLIVDENTGTAVLAGKRDVNIQDQTTAFDDFFFVQQIGVPTALDGNIIFDPLIPQYTIDVLSIASISIGDTIFIFTGVTGEERFYDAVVLGISVLTLTLDRPIDFSFEDGDIIISTTKDLNVDGSVTPQVFEIRAGGAGSTLEFDITRMLIENLSATAVDLSTFGDIAGGITRGLQLRDKLSATEFKNKWNIKQNKDFGLLGFDWDPFAAANPVQGQDGFLWRYSLGGQDKHGVVKRIGTNRSLQLIVQDNLLTLLTLTGIGGNHEVEP